MSEIDTDVYYIVAEGNWLKRDDNKLVKINPYSSFIVNNNGNKELQSTYDNKTCVYQVDSCEEISFYENLIIPHLSTIDGKRDISVSFNCTIKHPDFITTKIKPKDDTSNSITIKNDYISGNITKTSNCNFNKVFGIKDTTTYTPFTSSYELSYNTLTVDKDFEFCNLGKLTVGELTIEKNKKLTVLSGTVTVTGKFTMEDNSEIICKTLEII